jgi:hypothetical protein
MAPDGVRNVPTTASILPFTPQQHRVVRMGFSMRQALALAACLAVIPTPTSREAAGPNQITFRAVQRGLVTSVQCNYFGGWGFEGQAISFRQHGRRFTIRGLNGQLECTAEDGTPIATAKELRARTPWAGHIYKDAITGELVIRAYCVDHDPQIVAVL